MPGDKFPEDTKPVGLASFLEDVIITKSEKATKTKLDQAKHEMEVYMNSDMLNLKHDPLMWWKEYGWRLPLLSGLAKECLCVPATSVPSERVFSTAGDILSAQRAAMVPDKVVTQDQDLTALMEQFDQSLHCLLKVSGLVQIQTW